jgi:hypothetical protein
MTFCTTSGQYFTSQKGLFLWHLEPLCYFGVTSFTNSTLCCALAYTYIMDHVLASNEFKPHEIRSINYCRLYLQAVTISDIANASGTRIADGILKGDLSLVPSRTKWHLVNQAKPDRTTWRVWRRACDLFSTSGTLY